MSSVDGNQRDARAVRGKESADGVELGGEDAQDDQREGELAERSPDVGALKGPLCGTDLDEVGVGDGCRWLRSRRGAVARCREWEAALEDEEVRTEIEAGEWLSGYLP